MAEPWHDINSPGWLPSSKEGQSAQCVASADDAPPPKKQPVPKEYRITSVRAVEPAQGFELNKPFDIEGNVEQIGEAITQPRVSMYPIGIYNNEEDQFVPGGIDAFIDSDTREFCGTCKYLFNPQPYDNDTGKSADATWDLIVRAKGATAKEPAESGPLTFPQPSKFVILKKDDYDENGADRYSAPRSGDNFKPNGVVKALQGDFITTGFLPKDSDDGYFGEQTDSAVREFQDFAIKNERMQRTVGKVETTDKVLDQSQPDGIVGNKTRDELDRWLQHDWIKPVPILRYGDYDKEAINKGVKSPRPYKRPGDFNDPAADQQDDYHEVGTPVLDAQKSLQDVAVYTGCNLDGWFGENMKDAVTRFQEAAEKGEFAAADDTQVVLDSKLTDYRKGILDNNTQDVLKKVGKNGWKVPNINKYVFPLRKRPVESYKEEPRSFGSNRNNGKRKHAACDLYAPIGTEVLAVADGVIFRGPYEFAGGTYALEVDHGEYIVRYTEIKGECPADIMVGAKVNKGQVIGYIGRFVAKDGTVHHMLHFELYTKTAEGTLTDMNNPPYLRRSDLENPTEFLDKAALFDQ